MLREQHSSDQTLQQIGARTIPEFDGVHDVWPRGERLKSVRAADNAVTVPSLPLVTMINRMVVVQYDDFNGRPRTLVFEPTVPAGSAKASLYSNLQKVVNAIPGDAPASKVILKYFNEPDVALAKVGFTPEDGDFCTFDHLHVQNPRMILGSTNTVPGQAVYAASKHAVMGFSSSTTADLRLAGAIARLGAAFPRLRTAALPLLAAQGRRVQKKLLLTNGPTQR